MTKIIFNLLVYIMLISSSLGEPDNGGVYRHSGCYQNEFLYVADQIAIHRGVRYYDSEIPEIFYTLYRAKWLGEPELVGQTGDTVSESLVTSIRWLNWFPIQRVLVGKGTDPKAESDQRVYFLISIDSGLTTLYRTETELKRTLDTLGIKQYSPTGIELSFRRLVTARDELKKSKSVKASKGSSGSAPRSKGALR